MIEHIISLLAPHRCIICGSEGSLLCYACDRMLARAPTRCLMCMTNCSCPSSASGRIFCATPYFAAAKELVHRLKFDRAKAAANDMVRIMVERLPVFDAQPVVVHIPTAPARVRQRGYDQAAILANRLARSIGCQNASLLYRDNNSRQVGKDRLKRWQQADTMFASKSVVMPKHVLLVDDVLTTGATLRAAAAELRGAGVQHITAAVFAAAEKFG